jgi:Alpha-1,3-glucanase catalytic domain D1/F5/8 type C domain/Alpha-1,3-glucanase catalytic domain D2
MFETSAEPASAAAGAVRRSRRFKLTVIAAAGVVAAAITAVAVSRGHSAAPTTRDTVAGSPPSLTAGRGAAVPFVEQEAVNAKTNGTILPESRAWDTLAGEAVGRRAVTLKGRGQYVEFTLSQPANSIDVRYSIPDSPDGSAYTASLSLYLNGAKQKSLTLTNAYSWYYGAYPFVNEPSSGNPHHFYDEVHELLGQELPVGAKVRLQVDAADTAVSYTIDLADFQQVAPALTQPPGSVSVTDAGADPTGVADSTGAFKKAVASALAKGTTVWVPPGTFQVNKHLVVSDNVTIEGAGPWYSTLTGDGIGIYGNNSPHPSTNVHLSNFAIEGTVTERDDAAQVNGIGGGMGGGSTISNLWIEHTKVGIWFDGPFDGLTVTGNRIDDTTADGINLHDGITDANVSDNFIRNTGDDGIAAWSENDPDTDDVISFNTVEVPILANNIAVYGGADNAVTDDVVSDTQTQGGGIHVANRFNAVALAGTTTIARDTTLRAGVLDPNWKYGVGALWFWADDSPMAGAIRVDDVDLIDSSYEAVEFAGASVSNVAFSNVRIAGAGTFALQLESHGEASFNNVVATDIGGPAGIYDCVYTGSDTSAFTIKDLGGNSGWNSRYCGKWPSPVNSYQYRQTASTDEFGLTPQQAAQAVSAGDSAQVELATSVMSGSAEQVALAARGAPPGVQVDISPSSVLAGGNATMKIATTAAVAPGRYPITVTGTAASGTRTTTYTLIVAAPGSGPLAPDRSSLTFDGQSVGTPSDPKPVRITNTGSALVTISSISTTGDFEQTNTCGTAIAANQSCTVNVTLSATAAGPRAGALTIEDDAGPLTVALGGTAGSSNLALNKTATASGTQDGYPTSNMTDGNSGSYWESTNNAFPQWASVDLGAVTTISKIVLAVPPPSDWTTRVQTLSVLGSVDGTTFSTILPSAGYTFDPAKGNEVTIKLPPTKVRYVKLDVTANTGWPAAQFSEFEIFQ